MSPILEPSIHLLGSYTPGYTFLPIVGTLPDYLIITSRVLYILTGYQVLGIVYLDQLFGAHHTHISYHNLITQS